MKEMSSIFERSSRIKNIATVAVYVSDQSQAESFWKKELIFMKDWKEKKPPIVF